MPIKPDEKIKTKWYLNRRIKKRKLLEELKELEKIKKEKQVKEKPKDVEKITVDIGGIGGIVLY